MVSVSGVCATDLDDITSDNVTHDWKVVDGTVQIIPISNNTTSDKSISVIINEVKEFNIINACEINNAVDFEVPFNFKEDYKHKDGSFIRYKNGCDHLINIQKIESEEDYYFYFVDGDDMKIFKTDTPNIYKRCETDGVFCEIDFIEMVKVNNKTYAVFILDTAQVDVWYDPTSLQDELNEFNKLNGIKPLKFL
ncbi:MAG: hypothetical protein MJ224_07535 [archaeon]|nr:hypothetical protein [archaeon]